MGSLQHLWLSPEGKDFTFAGFYFAFVSVTIYSMIWDESFAPVK